MAQLNLKTVILIVLAIASIALAFGTWRSITGADDGTRDSIERLQRSN